MEKILNEEYEARKEELRAVGDVVEAAIVSNELVYLSLENAKKIKANIKTNWEVFSTGYTWQDKGEKLVEILPKHAMTGSVLNARALLVMAALGEAVTQEVLLSGLSKAIKTNGGGVWKEEGRKMSEEEVLTYAKNFIEERRFVRNFSFGKAKTEEEEKVMNRLEAAVNGAYYMLATAVLAENSAESFERVQKDLLLSANLRLPILKGHERSLSAEERTTFEGFAQAAPIRHLSPGCLGAMMEAMAKK